MNSTRLLLVTVLSIAVLLVVGALVWSTVYGDEFSNGLATSRAPTQHIIVITARSVEPWVRAAAEEFNQSGHKAAGASIEVEVVPMDGLIALGKWERNDFNALPTEVRLDELSARERAALDRFPAAWIPDSRYLVDMANAANRNHIGRDPFLSDGQYRTRSVAVSLLAWGFFRSRGTALQENLGEISWSTLRIAAAAPTGWKELGGDPAWGLFKLALPDPRTDAGGIATMMAAAAEYYQRTDIAVEDVTDAKFQTWLAALMTATADSGGINAYSADEFAFLGHAAGDGGQFIESDLLQNMQGILTRWDDPLLVRYPRFTTLFDFPFAIWVGPETSAKKKDAALAFQRFLLSEAQQRRALSFGLRPANLDIHPVSAEDSLFAQWQKLGVEDDVPPREAIGNPNRDVLLALLRWYDQNVAQ